MTSISDDDKFARQFSWSMHKLFGETAGFTFKSSNYLSFIIKQEKTVSHKAFEYHTAVQQTTWYLNIKGVKQNQFVTKHNGNSVIIWLKGLKLFSGKLKSGDVDVVRMWQEPLTISPYLKAAFLTAFA